MQVVEPGQHLDRARDWVTIWTDIPAAERRLRSIDYDALAREHSAATPSFGQADIVRAYNRIVAAEGRSFSREPRAPDCGRGSDGDDRPRLRYGEVCAGIGCISAAWRGLLEPAFVSEIDPFCNAVLAARLPNVPNLGDLRSIDGADWRGKIDVLWGSPPCQDLSIAGTRRGFLAEGGQLTLVFADLADVIDPEYLIWENVRGALSVQGGQTFGVLLGRLLGESSRVAPDGGRWPNAGYLRGPRRAVAWRLLDAQYSGLAQRRERVFLVGCPRGGADPKEILFEPERPCRDRPPLRPDPQANPGAVIQGPVFYVNGDTRPKIERDLAATLKADPSAVRRAAVCVDGAVRSFLPVECERLQGLPDGWTDISWGGRRDVDTLRRSAIGNGVAVPDARWIGERLVAAERNRRSALS